MLLYHSSYLRILHPKFIYYSYVEAISPNLSVELLE